MRLQLDNGKTYDIHAMITPKHVGRRNAWLAFRSNLSAWPKGLRIPIEFESSLRGVINWLIVFSLHTLSLLLLPVFCIFGYSLKAYTFFTREDAEKLEEYRSQLQNVYRQLSHIEDREEYQKRLEEEVQKIKPY